jgi:hypothetical protein
MIMMMMMIMMIMVIIIIMKDAYWKELGTTSHIKRHKRLTQIIMLVDVIGDKDEVAKSEL